MKAKGLGIHLYNSLEIKIPVIGAVLCSFKNISFNLVMWQLVSDKASKSTLSMNSMAVLVISFTYTLLNSPYLLLI
jgi:hypothetical protein